jgi:phosphoglycolate phosphatase
LIRLIVFDLDGTLVDSRRDLADAANALLHDLKRPPLPEERVGEMVGEGAAVLVGRVLAASALPADMPGALPRFLELYDQRLLAHTRPYDGIVEALHTLQSRATLAVLTNKPQAATEKVLAGLDLARYFIQVIGGNTPLGRKPNPGGLAEIVRRTRAEITSTTLVGDSPVDLETGRRAGCQVVLARYGFGFRNVELQGIERMITSPAELANLF